MSSTSAADWFQSGSTGSVPPSSAVMGLAFVGDLAGKVSTGQSSRQVFPPRTVITIREMQVAPLQPLTYRVTATGGGGSVFGVNPLFRTA